MPPDVLEIDIPLYPQKVRRIWNRSNHKCDNRLFSVFVAITDCLETWSAFKPKGHSACGFYIPEDLMRLNVNGYNKSGSLSSAYTGLDRAGMIHYYHGQKYPRAWPPVLILRLPPDVSVDDVREEKHQSHYMNIVVPRELSEDYFSKDTE